MRRTKWTLFLLLFVSYAYFYQAGGWNQNSRFDLVRAITNEHTLNIDPFVHSTGDKAFANGHYYSDKAPGLAFAAVPVVAVVRPFLHAAGGDPETYAGLALLSYLATVFTAGLFTALAGVSLFSLSMELGANRAGALFATIVFGLATPIWVLATIFIGHAFAAALLVFAFAAACRIGAAPLAAEPGTAAAGSNGTPARPRNANVWRAALVGLCAGWATISEFPAAVPAIIIAVLVAIRAWRFDRGHAVRIVGAMTVTALGCAGVLMIYQSVCFGSPFSIAYTTEEDAFVGMQRGFFGVTLPRLVRLRRILFGEYRGLLPIAPVLALTPIGLALIKRRGVAVVAALVAAYFILLNASYIYWEGGWSYGPRHAAPAIPFLCLGLGALWTISARPVRWVLAALAAYSVAVTLVAVSTMPLPPNNIRRPVAELMWPAFRDGDLALNTQTFVSGGANPDFRAHTEPKAAFNLGMKAGLQGRASLLPLALAWVACAAVLSGRVRRR